MRSLGSDNHAGVHPLILKSLSQVNSDHSPSYGTDKISHELNKKVRELLGAQWNSFHCFNGTAANVLCLKALVQSYHSILCTDISHLNMDECGAPEFHIGSKLITIPHQNGKINLVEARKKLIRFGDQHFSQVKALSITQPTEVGTTYSLNELREIAKFCKENNLYFHIDGARLPNAAYTLKAPLKKIIKDADAVSFGGTKNGLLGSELVLLKKEHSKDFKFIRKQSLQLPSKTRFLAIQFLEFFKDDLYLKIAQQSCETAKSLKELIETKTPLKANYPVESNAVFVNLPKKIVKELKKEVFFYIWDPEIFEARLMTGFDTKKKDLQKFTKKLAQLLEKEKLNTK